MHILAALRAKTDVIAWLDHGVALLSEADNTLLPFRPAAVDILDLDDLLPPPVVLHEDLPELGIPVVVEAVLGCLTLCAYLDESPQVE